ncbi:cardiolipin synthase [Mucilaginibacter pallidiroseus]|uniref:Cardiolipin synthase n=1 Tax=Mucilaginibacter pallidiroseus TaxID=2599295 RepID=A0A563UHX4_9SPHI|nr:cardiolipin synthase [Mucilaginibacter pallidiroseus]TWR30965.1 cardiolipin synthase [Mucilaginibacter pallidiroseus]
MHPTLLLSLEIIYTLIVIAVCLRIVYDTRSTTKTLAYLLITIFLPVIGIILYFTLGVNYRKNKLYSKKIINNDRLLRSVRHRIMLTYEKAIESGRDEITNFRKLAALLLNDGWSPLSGGNKVKLLLNGENKFADVIAALKAAKKHIHIEYYIFDDDHIGNQLKDVLITKVREGVEVRFIYDDFGSRSIRRRLVPQLREAGVHAYPFYRVRLLPFANRLNYRNHRKIIIIDGCTAFTGGINVSDRYINNPEYHNRVYWRDTHLRIDGPGTYYLQFLFIGDWNFCSDQALEPSTDYFCLDAHAESDTTLQVAASGPDSDSPTILLSLLQAISLAQNEICITSPYFIPGESLYDALNAAALSGVKVKILLPRRSDSFFVDWAARSYYAELMDAGIEIYLYTKGFIHAKTLVADGQLAIVGTANMDNRSFELNFEVNTIVYDEDLASQLRAVFMQDLEDAEKLNQDAWQKRQLYRQLPEKLARLLSPLL